MADEPKTGELLDIKMHDKDGNPTGGMQFDIETYGGMDVCCYSLDGPVVKYRLTFQEVDQLYNLLVRNVVPF